MSKENVAFFSRAISRNADLNKRVTEAEPTMEAWVKIAQEAGFEFTPEEFAEVVGETLGRSVTTSNAVSEYLGARYTLGDGELSEKALNYVSGGMINRFHS
jgi:predicted ribosomally synthesized peptide with nif11-like leader